MVRWMVREVQFHVKRDPRFQARVQLFASSVTELIRNKKGQYVKKMEEDGWRNERKEGWMDGQMMEG